MGKKNIDPGQDPTGRQGRWAIELSMYDFSIGYRPRSKHTNAAALTRIPEKVGFVGQSSNAEEQVDPNTFLEKQKSEEHLSIMRGWLLNGKPQKSESRALKGELKKLYG